MTDQNKDVYARTEGMAIVEFPVYREHIEARGHSVDMYVKVETQPLPKDSKFLIIRPRVLMQAPDAAIQYYESRNATIGELFEKLHRDAGNPETLLSADADSEILDKLTNELIDGYTAFVLAERAKEHKWQTLDRVLAMVNSANPEWKKDAEFMMGAYHAANDRAQALINSLKQPDGVVPKNRQALDDILAIPAWPVEEVTAV